MKKDMHLRIHVKKLIFVFSTTVAVGYVLFPKDSSPGVSNGNHEKVALFHQKPSFIKNQTCQFKKKSIFYIKIQKTGSSTVKSMLYNYASKHDMKICLDHTDVHHMNFPYRLDESKLVKLSGKHQCEMVADELVLDKPQVLNLMSGDPYIVTSVRNPLHHFVSMYKFSLVHYAVEMLTLLKLDFWDGVRIFLNNPVLVRTVYNTFKKDEIHDFALQHLVRPNLQTFSLGLSPKALKKEIEAKAKEINFFIVSDDFYGSVVSMAKDLCVPFADLVFVRQNINHNQKERVEDAPSDVVDLIRKFNANDFFLYDIAQRRLQISKRDYPGYKNDIEIYKSVIDKYARECEAAGKPLAMVDGNYCLSEVATFFYETIRKDSQKALLRELQKQYNKLNPS